MLKESHLEQNVTPQSTPIKQRHHRFSGTKNFRDLGGYHTVEGKTLRYGLLFRSDALHKLTDRDLERLSAFGLDCVIDFRSVYEKGLEPDRLPADSGIRLVEIPILDSSTSVVQEPREELVKKLRQIDPFQFMTETYGGFVTQFTPEFQKFFRTLISAEGRPVLFHCTAGKDRTGFAAAVLLRMLGVPHETVIQDYLLTNDYFYAGHRRNLLLAYLFKGVRFGNTIKGFLRADLRYLSVAFDTIDREYGSLENYIRGGIGLSVEDVERLKAIYLE